jgi:hypothetical protein
MIRNGDWSLPIPILARIELLRAPRNWRGDPDLIRRESYDAAKKPFADCASVVRSGGQPGLGVDTATASTCALVGSIRPRITRPSASRIGAICIRKK